MILGVDPAPSEYPDRTHGPGRTLVAGAVLLLAAAGLLLWWSRGAAVFGDVVLAALAWCF